MRSFQLSAVLVSTGILLSGCYLGRPSVDRSRLERAESAAQVCDVSSAPLAADATVAILSLAVALVSIPMNMAFQQESGSNSEAGLILGPVSGLTWSAGIIGGVFAADAVAGAFVVRDCKAAQEEWGIMKKMEAQRKQDLTVPQPPATVVPQPPATVLQPPATVPQPPVTAPQPPATVPQHPVNQRRHPTSRNRILPLR